MTHPGLLVTLEAKQGKQEEVASFLVGGLTSVVKESATTTWYAFRISDTTFGIYDTFTGEAGREAHLSGEVAQALMGIADDLLAVPPDVRPLDVLACKSAV